MYQEGLSFFKGSFLSYLVGLYVFAFFLELHLRWPFLQTVRFQFLFGAVLGVLCIFRMSRPLNKYDFTKPTKYGIALLVIMGIYTVFSMNSEISRVIYVDRGLKFAAISLFIWAAVEKTEDLKTIVALMLLAWLKIGQEGLVGWLTGNMVWYNQGIPRLRGSTIMYLHPNSYSGFAVGCIPFCYFLFSWAKSFILKMGFLLLGALAIVIIINTGSRTGYVAFFLTFISLFFMLKNGKLKLFILSACLFPILLQSIPEYYVERFESIFTGEEKEGASSATRKEIIVDAIAVYKSYPLGVGVAAFPTVREQMFGRHQDTHNLYLEVLTNIGPVGFTVFILFIWQLLKLNWVNTKLARSKTLAGEDERFIESICLSIVGYILVRLFLGLFGMDLYEVYWWLALGLTLACNKLLNKQISSTSSTTGELIRV